MNTSAVTDGSKSQTVLPAPNRQLRRRESKRRGGPRRWTREGWGGQAKQASRRRNPEREGRRRPAADDKGGREGAARPLLLVHVVGLVRPSSAIISHHQPSSIVVTAHVVGIVRPALQCHCPAEREVALEHLLEGPRGGGL